MAHQHILRHSVPYDGVEDVIKEWGDIPGKDLECAAAGDHVAAVAGGIQVCTENGAVPQIIRQCKLSATAALTLQL